MVETKLERGIEARSVEEAEAGGETGTGEEAEDAAWLDEETIGAAVLDEGAGEPEPEQTPVGEAGAAAATPAVGVSPVLVQPDLSVISVGQATVSQLTVGLSAPWKKEPQRKPQPGWRAQGNWPHVSVEGPPYC